MLLSWIYVIPAIAVSLAALVFWLKHRTLIHPGGVLIFFYWVSSVGALFVNTDTLPGFNFLHTWSMLLGYSSLLLLALVPGFFIKPQSPPSLSDNPVFRILILVMLPLAWFSLFYQIPYALVSMQSGADVVRGRLNTEEFSPLPPNIWSTIATATSQFYPLYAMAFIEGYVRQRGKLYQISCAVGALCVVVNSICFAARDGVLWFLISFWMGYWVYRRQLVGRFRGAIRLLTLAALVGALLILSVFTYQRFAEARVGFFDSLLTYASQQPYVFAETVAEQDEFYGLNLRFPMLAAWMGSFESIKRENVYEWTFGTFAKDFYQVAGWSSAYGIVLGIAAFFTPIFIRGGRLNPVAYTLLLILYFQFMAQGVFYFRLGIRAGNYYILFILLLAGAIQLMGGNNARRDVLPEADQPEPDALPDHVAGERA